MYVQRFELGTREFAILTTWLYSLPFGQPKVHACIGPWGSSLWAECSLELAALLAILQNLSTIPASLEDFLLSLCQGCRACLAYAVPLKKPGKAPSNRASGQ